MIFFKNSYPVTVVIGDPHSSPGHDNDRFLALSRFLAHTQPDNIVQIGDFMSLDSISPFSTTRPLLREGKRLVDDLDHGRNAYDLMMSEINHFNDTQTKQHKKKYSPRMIWHNANHEDRVFRYIVDSPELLGLIDHTDLLDVKKDGWEVYPYKEYSFIHGTGFTHVPMNKRVNQPISGEYVSRRAADMHNFSVVFGHTHRLTMHESKVRGCNIVQAINCGWFGDYAPEYVAGNEDSLDWWGGVVVLTHYDEGMIDISTVSMDVLKREYL